MSSLLRPRRSSWSWTTSTHTPASLYAAFLPAKAKRLAAKRLADKRLADKRLADKRLADKLEVHNTPKHGSWLNMAEIELSVLARQFLAERMDTKAHLQGQIAA